jgi:thioredoxin reductase (NADPH)
MSITDTVWRILFSSKTQAIRVNTLSNNLTENLTALKKLLPSEDILSYEFETEDKIPCCIFYADGVVNKQLLGDLIARPLSRLSLQKEGGMSALNIDGAFMLRDSVSPSILVGGLNAENGHVVVDRDMSTNLKGLFAAGDCTGRPYQYAKAVGEGNIAAHSVSEYLK